jgi:hypothetical protein
MKKLFFSLLLMVLAAGMYAQKYEAESAVLAGGANKVAGSAASEGSGVTRVVLI